jgi:peptidoglycan/LPS O-acetylase OafA/YrhL
VGVSSSAGVLRSRLRHRISLPRLHWSILLAVTAALLVIPKPAEVRWLYDTVFVIILFPLQILAGTQSEPSSPKLLRMFLLVGSFSYGLYAIHTPVLRFGHLTAEMDPERSYKLLMLAFFALARGAAVAADLLYDRPVRKMISERLSNRQWRRMVASKGGALPKAQVSSRPPSSSAWAAAGFRD